MFWKGDVAGVGAPDDREAVTPNTPTKLVNPYHEQRREWPGGLADGLGGVCCPELVPEGLDTEPRIFYGSILLGTLIDRAQQPLFDCGCCFKKMMCDLRIICFLGCV